MSDNTDFIAKLQQIEVMAIALGARLDEHARTRTHHIVILARYLRGRLELGNARISPGDASEGAPDPETKPPR
jgi:hypothetical protein